MTRHVIRFAHALVEVPDPGASTEFLTTGLRFAHERRDDVDWFVPRGEYNAPGRPGLGLVEGSATKLRQITADVEPGSLDAVAANLDGLEHPWTRDDTGLRTADPAGTPLLLRVPEPEKWPQPAAQNTPRRLGHINFKLPGVLTVDEFWQRAFGAKKSEQIGKEFAFLRFGSEHHNLGLREGEGPAIHHLGFQLPGWDAYREICDHLAETGYSVEYGPGRHGPGNNIFIYVVDPTSGLRFELFTDMEHIHDENHYEPPRWQLSDRPRTMNKWGPAPPDSFLFG
ncbi:VOC family protein [Amycolatopsis sp. NPDC051903]|uniref:VOC family protein n=1 Tax=Amycolatopsis sp. NPDC051903 TaxID=3363936 RepID=UPI00379CC3DA